MHALVDPAHDLLEGHLIVGVGGPPDGQSHRYHGDVEPFGEARVQGGGTVGDDGDGHDLSVRAMSADVGSVGGSLLGAGPGM